MSLARPMSYSQLILTTRPGSIVMQHMSTYVRVGQGHQEGYAVL